MGDSEEDLEDLDEDQIMKILKDQGMMKKEKNELKAMPLFQGVECKMSFYIFSKTNFIRIHSYKFIQTKLWDNYVMFLIGLSSIKLAFDTYFIDADKNSLVMIISTEYVDLFFNLNFIAEMTINDA